MKLKNLSKIKSHPILCTLFILILLGVTTFFYREIGMKILIGIIIISFAYVFTRILGRRTLRLIDSNKNFFRKRPAIKAFIHSTHWMKLFLIAYIAKDFVYQECVANKYAGFYFNLTFNMDVCVFYLNLGTMIIPFLLLAYDLTDLLIAKYIKKIINE